MNRKMIWKNLVRGKAVPLITILFISRGCYAAVTCRHPYRKPVWCGWPAHDGCKDAPFYADAYRGH